MRCLQSGFKLVTGSSFGFSEFIWTLHREKEDGDEASVGLPSPLQLLL